MSERVSRRARIRSLRAAAIAVTATICGMLAAPSAVPLAPSTAAPVGAEGAGADPAQPPAGQAYWLVGSDGGLFAFGDAGFFGSSGAMALNKPVVGMGALVDTRPFEVWLLDQILAGRQDPHLRRPLAVPAAG